MSVPAFGLALGVVIGATATVMAAVGGDWWLFIAGVGVTLFAAGCFLWNRRYEEGRR